MQGVGRQTARASGRSGLNLWTRSNSHVSRRPRFTHEPCRRAPTHGRRWRSSMRSPRCSASTTKPSSRAAMFWPVGARSSIRRTGQSATRTLGRTSTRRSSSGTSSVTRPSATTASSMWPMTWIRRDHPRPRPSARIAWSTTAAGSDARSRWTFSGASSSCRADAPSLSTSTG